MIEYILQPEIIAIILLWLLTAIPAYAAYTYFIQLKEYRWDKSADFLRSAQGHAFMLEYHFFARAVIGLAVYVMLRPYADAHLIFLIILAIDVLALAVRTRQVGIQRPRFTKKASLVLGSSLALEAFLIYLIHIAEPFIVLIMARFVIIAFVTILYNIPTHLAKRFYIARAKRKLATYQDLTTIGITGSYGKSSVKEFLSHILGTAHNVVKTPRNTNTEIGIAKFILATDFRKAEYFVCEMGAYSIGEIAQICDMVRPDVGLLTAINQQHIALFGSIKNTQKAKYELLRAIPNDGLVVTNADNPYCTEFLSELTCEKIRTFGTDAELHPDCLITNITSTLEGTTYEGTCMGKKERIVTPVIGAHHAMNIAPAMMIAKYCGMTLQQLLDAALTLPTDIHGSLKLYTSGSAHIIDDSYNGNPAGFRSALDVLSLSSSTKKRVVITRGLLELGAESTEAHQRLGEEIAFVADELIITSKDSAEALKDGVGSKYKTTVDIIDDQKELIARVKTLLQENIVILLENKIAPAVYAVIQEKRN